MKPRFISAQIASNVVSLLGEDNAERLFYKFGCVHELSMKINGKNAKVFDVWHRDCFAELPTSNIPNLEPTDELADGTYTMPDRGLHIPYIWFGLYDIAKECGVNNLALSLQMIKVETKVALIDEDGKKCRAGIANPSVLKMVVDAVEKFNNLTDEEFESLREAEKHASKPRKATVCQRKFVSDFETAINKGETVSMFNVQKYEYIKNNFVF